jgi:UDP-glucose 4-epimerase
MKILVTGGAGFIASHIADKYIELRYDVVVVDNLYTGKREFVNPKARFYEADIRDKEKIRKIFEEEKPEILNHHAAQMDVRKSVADPGFDAQVNIIGLINLMEAGRISGLKKVIFASSGGAIYGDASALPTPETFWPKPASPYGISKWTTEHYLDFYYQAYGIDYTALRYGNVYGPRQNPHGEAGVVAIFTQRLLNNQQPMINGDGKQTRDFVYVGDVVNANIKALNSAVSLTVNIGTGKQTDINTIYDLLVKLTGTNFPQDHREAKPGEQRVSVLDNKFAKQKLGWEPITELDQGLEETVKYFKTKSLSKK